MEKAKSKKKSLLIQKEEGEKKSKNKDMVGLGGFSTEHKMVKKMTGGTDL